MIEEREKYKSNRGKLAVIAVVLIAIFIFSIPIRRIYFQLQERAELIQINKELKKKKKALKNELKNVNDADYIEDQARLQLRLIKPGETIFILEKDKKDSDKEAIDDKKEEEVKNEKSE